MSLSRRKALSLEWIYGVALGWAIGKLLDRAYTVAQRRVMVTWRWFHPRGMVFLNMAVLVSADRILQLETLTHLNFGRVKLSQMLMSSIFSGMKYKSRYAKDSSFGFGYFGFPDVRFWRREA